MRRNGFRKYNRVDLSEIIGYIVGFVILIVFVIGIGFLSSIFWAFLYSLQIRFFGNKGMILLSPGTFAYNHGVPLTVILFIILVIMLFISRAVKKVRKYFLILFLLWIFCFANTFFPYTVFNEDNIFHRSIKYPLGITYSYSDVKEVSVYSTIDLLSRYSDNDIIHYDLVMKDGNRINLIPIKLTGYETGNDIYGFGRIESKIQNVPHFVNRDFLEQSYEARKYPWRFTNFKVVE